MQRLPLSQPDPKETRQRSTVPKEIQRISHSDGSVFCLWQPGSTFFVTRTSRVYTLYGYGRKPDTGFPKLGRLSLAARDIRRSR